ncbi:MAG TPA: hypothetical protein VHK69_06795 [Chitinophagaceae bacterium]|jgi:hypothetical protein|nr:hypothetical protein [Chitinophagaceae bacterium]
MDFVTFRSSITTADMPAGLSPYQQALWQDALGHWGEAHELIQDLPDRTASWIHAYLHRKEGDTGNADYWYSKAGRRRPAVSLEEEWEEISKAVCGL